MGNYKKIALKSLQLATARSKTNRLNESVVYPDGLTERMSPDLEVELIDRKHSLGKHPTFPDDDDDSTFEQRIMGNRFSEVAKRYKNAFDCDSIDNNQLLTQMLPLLKETVKLESKHIKALEKLAEKMIRDEYDIDKDVVDINVELTPNINMVGTKKNPKAVTTEVTFKNHDEILLAKDEVQKRRFLNAMIQGASKKCNHMFHMVDDELIDMDPRLPNQYSKIMSAADYMYYVIPKMEEGINGGIVRVQFPTEENPKAVIHVQAMIFPVLIHELVKGVMELLSAHGLPKDKKIGEYVINKADYLEAEPWDMRIGPALWEKFTSAIEPEDFNLKHYIYTDLASLPVKEFNHTMREIMSGTKEGKNIIKELVKDIKSDLKYDEFNEAVEKKTKPKETKTTFTLDDLINDNGDDVDTFNFEDFL